MNWDNKYEANYLKTRKTNGRQEGIYMALYSGARLSAENIVRLLARLFTRHLH